MLIGVVLRRLWRERRQMGVLLLALCLTSAFLALAPLYVRAVSNSELSRLLDDVSAGEARVELANPGPFAAEVDGVIEQHLAAQAQSPRRYALSVRPYANDVLRVQPAMYANFDDLFTLVEGEMPADYSGGNVPVIITQQARDLVRGLQSQYAQFGVGVTLNIGDTTQFVTVEIVGIVEAGFPPEHDYWDARERQLFGVRVPTTSADLGELFLVTTPEIYSDRLAPVLVDEMYFYRLDLVYDDLNFDNRNAFLASVGRLAADVRQIHPQSETRAALIGLLESFNADVTETKRPVLLIAFLILVLMLYNLTTTISLILEQQREEWATIASRGGSQLQLLGIHFASLIVLGIIAALLGPLIASGILHVLASIGPQADILMRADVSGLTANAFLLSGVAAALAVILCIIPARSLLRTSLLTLKRSVSRPPDKPAWARYYVDAILLTVGVAFILRLYVLASDAENPLSALFDDPGALPQTLSQPGVATLDDPFSVLGPALLLTGAALLWIRIFPVVMRLMGNVLNSFNDLTTSLALWNVERNPGHYGQIVLLIIGTLALGTASLALTETRTSGALSMARQTTGGDVRLIMDPATVDLQTNWLSLPRTVSVVPVLAAHYPEAVAGGGVTLFGVEPQQVQTAFPQFAATLAPLNEDIAMPQRGIDLAEDSARLLIDVYTEPDAFTDMVELELSALLQNEDSVLVPVLMESVRNGTTGEFITFSADNPFAAGTNWRFAGLRFSHERILPEGRGVELFQPMSFVDNLRVMLRDGSQQVLIGFEEDDYASWQWAADVRASGSILITERAQVSQGRNSLRVSYRPERTRQPEILYRTVEPVAIPALVSPGFATIFGNRSSLRRPLQVGDELTSQLATSVLDSQTIRYRVVGILQDFPTVQGDQPYLVTRRSWLQAQINASATPADFFGINEVWLDLETPEPTAELRQRVAALPGFIDADYAWSRFQAIQRDPLANGITGMLFAGFWISLALILLDFGFYMAVTTRRRSVSMAVLRAIGWNRQSVWRMLTVEQAAFITPALFVGFALGALIAYLILPFLTLTGGSALRIPMGQVTVLLLVLVLTFTLLLAFTAVVLQRMDVNRALRQQE